MSTRTRGFARRRRGLVGLLVVAGVISAAGTAGALPSQGQAARAGSATGAGTFDSRVFADGSRILHPVGSAGSEPISQPDDLTQLDGRIFVAFQNGVGPQGQPSSSGNRDSTIVEFTAAGHEVGQWDVVGKCDGLTADPRLGRVIATVNEDADSSLYLLNPAGTGTLTHYTYANAVPSKGGTDAIDIYKGMILISGSAPGTTGKAAPQASYPAVYAATLDAGTKTVKLSGVFSDEASATMANQGADGSLKLALTDPDSNATVPAYAARFGGDFELTSQGDEEMIFVSGIGTAQQKLDVLKLHGSFDDTAWPSTSGGTLYVTDNAANRIFAVTGPFARGEEIASETPCDANDAPSTCPAVNFPSNYLATLDPETGKATPLALRGTKPAAQSLLFVP